MSHFRICPTILAADFTRLHEAIDLLQQSGCAHLHMDIMDGHYVPPITFGAKMVQDVRRIFTGTIDVHLMVTNPLDHLESFAAAGADLIYVHLETVHSVAAVAEQIRQLGKRPGIALYQPAESAWQDLLAHLDQLDAVLVATGAPGYAGRPLEISQLDKVSQLREKSSEINLMVDIGINEQTILQTKALGANWFAVSSAIFGSPLGISGAFTQLQSMVN